MKINQIQPAEFARNIFSVVVPAGTKIESILTPESWTHVASKLAKNARIEVYTEDSSYFAELIVAAVGKNWAKVVLAREVQLGADKSVPSVDSFFVKWGTPTTGFRVQRLSDKQVVKDGFETKELAEIWIAKYEEGVKGDVL